MNNAQTASIKPQKKSKRPFLWVDLEVLDLGLSPYELRVYLHILKRAGYDGQCWQSAASIAEEIDVGAAAVKRSIKVLLELNLIKIIPTPPHIKNPQIRTFAVIDFSVASSDLKDPTHDVSSDLKDPTDRQSSDLKDPGPSILDELDPNLRTRSPSDPSSPKVRYSAENFVLAEEWKKFALRQMPTLKIDLHQWADVSRLLEKDGLSVRDQYFVLEFVQNSDFWRPNAISLTGLRKKGKNDLKKWQNIVLNMKRDGTYRESQALQHIRKSGFSEQGVHRKEEDVPF